MWLVDDEVVTRWGMLVFITFISFIWHPWLMTKWDGCPIVITMIKNNDKSFDMNIDNLKIAAHLPMYLPIYLPTHPSINLFTYLPTKPPTYHLPTYPPIYLPTHPPTYHIPTNPPIHLPTYLLTTYHPTTCYLPHNFVMIWNKHVK
jgi:hypothetical protein